MIINHNLSAMNANRILGVNTALTDNSMAKLSSGLRINKAADDASGLAVSEKMRSQIRGLNQASRNINDGISFIQTTEGYLEETNDILQRLRELSVQSANGIYSDEDRAQIQVEVNQLIDEVNRVASQAQFNGRNLIDGTYASSPLVLQVGANMDQNESIAINTMTAAALGLTDPQGAAAGTGVNLSTAVGANSSIGAIDAALATVTKQRADLGAFQSRFAMAMRGVDIASENLQAAESRIRDANMATQVVDFTRNTILDQTTSAMLAQANNRSQNVLQLLR